MMTMFDWMFDGGTHSRLDVMNNKLDVLIEGQKETDDKLKGINETLQEILEEVKRRHFDGAAPGLAGGLRDLSSVLRIRLP